MPQSVVTVKVMRFLPDSDLQAHYDSFEVQVKKNMTVLDSLFQIVENMDPSVSFRCSCRAGMCGSCAMVINGREGLACRTKIEKLGDEVKVHPLRNLPIIKDLVVNMDPFFEKWQRIKPYFVPKEETNEFAAISPESGRREIIDRSLDCITCGACYSACTLVAFDSEYLGPAALNRAYTLVADERDAAADERLDAAGGEQGALRCHTLFNCMEVCPKAISPTWSIQKLKKRTVGRVFKRRR